MNVYSGATSAANDTDFMNSPLKQNGSSAVYGFGEAKSVGLRNQNSASLSTGKPTSGIYSEPHATGSQRVREKLLINSGGLAMGQS